MNGRTLPMNMGSEAAIETPAISHSPNDQLYALEETLRQGARVLANQR